MVCWFDTDTKKTYSIINDAEKFKRFYDHYKDTVWVGYNSRNYDIWIARAILGDFDPYEMSTWIIEKGRKGYEFSQALCRIPIYNYDTSVGFKSLKELEAYMGHDIRESSVPFTLQRKLTAKEIEEVKKYCMHDVMETAEVFLEELDEYESHVGLMEEFGLTLNYINKTKAQMSAVILEATRIKRDDEFDIYFPDTMDLGKYEYVKDWYVNWKENVRDYKQKLETEVCGVPHTFGFGGLHGSRDNYVDTGTFLLADVDSYYPAIMIEYNLLSRNVWSPEKYRTIRDERIKMKAEGDPKEYPRKIVLNGTFGASKDRFNNLYDPRNATMICVYGQMFLLDLLDKLEGHCEIIQTNTDGVLMKLYHRRDMDKIKGICQEWSDRTRMTLGYDEYTKVVQKDVNNYILVEPEGSVKSKGAYVKKLKNLDNDLPIVNKAIKDFFTKGVSIESTINSETKLINFQKITKVGRSYEYLFKENAYDDVHKYTKYKPKQRVRNKQVVKKWMEPVDDSKNGSIIDTRVNRTFATKNKSDGMLMKKSPDKECLDKVGGTPDNCVIFNDNVLGMEVPDWLDRSWYIDLAKSRVDDFFGGK